LESKGKQRNVVVYIIALLFTAGITYGSIAANSQDRIFASRSQEYEKAVSEMGQGNFSKSEQMFKNLLNSNPDSYILMWQCAISLMQQKKYEEAEQYFVKTQNQRPFIVKNQQYLAQYGETLYHIGNYKKAEKYLVEAKQLNTKPEITKQIEPVLAEIEQRTKAQ
jgi:predicted Zn-dependent protease